MPVAYRAVYPLGSKEEEATMTENNNDPKPALSPELFWRVLLVGNLMSLGVVLLVFHRMADTAMAPHLGAWIFGVGLLMALPAWLYHQYTLRQRKGLSENAQQLVQFNQVVVGCALAELPGLLGGVYYLFSREWSGTTVLVVVTAILLWQARPR